MALTVTVTPQSTWPDGTNITLAELRKTAKPSVAIAGSVSGSELASDSIDRTKIQHDPFFYAAESGAGADAIVVAMSPLPAALSDGLTAIIKVGTAAKGANPTLDIGQGGSKKIVKRNGAALIANEILGNQVIHLIYNSSLDSGSGAWVFDGSGLFSDEYVQGGGAANAHTVTLTPSPLAYYNGLVVRFRAVASNNAACTLNVNDFGAKPIKRFGSQDLLPGDIVTNQVVEAVYDGTNFQLLSAPNQGNSYYAADGGTTDDYAVTLTPGPTAYYEGMRVRFKANKENTGTASLNVNNLGARTILKNVADILSDNDIKYNQVVEVVYDGYFFQLIGLGRGLFASAGLPVPAVGAAVAAQTHGLGAIPIHVQWFFVCGTTAAGYAVGDEIAIENLYFDTYGLAFHTWKSATQIGLVRHAEADTVRTAHKTSGAEVVLTTGHWSVKGYARI